MKKGPADLHRLAAEASMSQLQLSWVQVKANEGSTQWQMLDLVLAQFDGIMAGYQARHEAEPEEIPPLSKRDLIFLNGNGMLSSLPAVCRRQPHALYLPCTHAHPAVGVYLSESAAGCRAPGWPACI
jgi:hypothetical protein